MESVVPQPGFGFALVTAGDSMHELSRLEELAADGHIDEETLMARSNAFLDQVEREMAASDSFGGDDYDGTNEHVMTNEEVVQQLMRIDEIGACNSK